MTSDLQRGPDGREFHGAKLVPLHAIWVPERVRKDIGDLQALADSITRVGLLQPIVISPEYRLICGGRRYRACEMLKWDTIPAVIVDIESMALGEIAENELRKNFTVSERAAIPQLIEEDLRSKERRGRPSQQIVDDRPPFVSGKTRDIAAQRAGFASAHGLRLAKQILETGIPEVVKAADDEEISLSAAARLAALAPEEQRRRLMGALPSPEPIRTRRQKRADAERTLKQKKTQTRPRHDGPRSVWINVCGPREFLRSLRELRNVADRATGATPAVAKKIHEELQLLVEVLRTSLGTRSEPVGRGTITAGTAGAESSAARRA